MQCPSSKGDGHDHCLGLLRQLRHTRNDTALTIACTLGAGELKDRVADIRALATHSLRSSHRKPLQLELVYDRNALGGSVTW